MTIDAALESRLAEIETKLSFAEDLVEELNRTVARQQQEIERLQTALRALREHVLAHLPPERMTPADDVPPHY